MRSVLELGDGALQPAPRPAARRRGVDEAPPQLAEPRRASSVAIEAQASRLGRSKQSRLRLFPDRGDSSSMMQFQVTGEWTNSCLELHPPFRWRCRSRSQSRTEGCSRLPDRRGSSQFLFVRVFLQSSLPFHFWPTCMALSGFQLKMFFAWKSHVHCTRAQSTSSSALELPDGQS